MFRKIIAIMIVGMFIFSGVGAGAAENDERKEQLTDIIKEPLKAVVAPLGAEGLVDLIFRPIEGVLLPLTDLSTIVVTPGRTREYVYNVNKNISVIDEEEIEQENPLDIQEVLNHEAGIVMNGYFGNPKDANIEMRGFGETGLLNYVVLIDGRKINQIDLSGADLSQIDVESIERIEVIRGANSVLYGDNATGGVINIITKKGRTGYRVKYTQEIGSYRRHKEYFSFDGGHDFLDYFFSYSNQNSDGYRLNNDYQANDVLANITVKPADNIDIGFSGSYHRDWYGMPGSLFLANIESGGRRATRFPDSKAKTEDYYMTIDPKIFGEWNGHEGVLSLFTSYRSRRTSSRNVYPSATYTASANIISWDVKPKCEVNSSFFEDSIENKLVFGVDYFRAENKSWSGDVTSTKFHVNIIKETLGVYASDNMLIDDRFIASGGIRGEWAEYVFDQTSPMTSSDKTTPSAIALDAGLGYKYNERSQIYVNYARSYRYPVTDEFFTSAYELSWPGGSMVVPASLNTDIEPQVANNYEIGIKDNSFESLVVNASYYLIYVKDEIYYDPNPPYINTNYTRTVHQGLELEARANIFKKIDAFFNYTFQKAYFVGGKYAGNILPLVPVNKISAGINVSPVEQFNINLICDYVSSRHPASDQVNAQPELKPYFTTDLNMSFKLENVHVYGSIKNIFGAKYFSTGSYGTAFYPAPERRYEGGVSVMF
jgi:iron complex outermembrane receptor protein